MKKLISLVTGVVAAFSAHGESPSWGQLLESSHSYLQTTQAELNQRYDLSSHERWDIDQQKGELVFSNAGKPAVIAKVQFVGSFSSASNSWLWSWANASVLPSLSSEVSKVKEYGEQHRFEKLAERKWPAEEADGWDMAAVTNYLLKGEGVYRPQFGNVTTFVVITDIRVVSQ
jgi:hypothetical protein